MSDVAIRVESIGKRYRVGERQRYLALRDVLTSAFRFNSKRKPQDHIWAVRDVSFEVQQGEVVGVIGRNGAGKSTLLKLLARITRPTEGRATLHGRIGSLLEVGTGFHPELTGRENVFLSGAILGMSKLEIERKFDEIVAFAVAAHLEPEILLVDEVLAVGDAAFQKKCLGKMSDVSRQGRTILFVSHNMAALRKLCSRAIWLDGGRIADSGGADDVVRHYLQKNTEANLESEWPDDSTAPGDASVRLRSVRLIPQEDSSGHITVHSPLRIECTYRNYVPGTVLNVSVVLNSLEESCVFASASDFAPRPAGLIRHTAEIPGDLLNVGAYYLNIMVVKDASRALFVQENVVAFEVIEGEVVGNWYGRDPGAVRPKLEWKSEVVEAADFAVLTARDRSV
ncbi:MAG: ABC transporter ATP-binding protein [Candidatus Acidiferrales bacterium]